MGLRLVSVQFTSGNRYSMGPWDATITGSVGCSLEGYSTQYRKTERALLLCVVVNEREREFDFVSFVGFGFELVGPVGWDL